MSKCKLRTSTSSSQLPKALRAWLFGQWPTTVRDHPANNRLSSSRHIFRRQEGCFPRASAASADGTLDRAGIGASHDIRFIKADSMAWRHCMPRNAKKYPRRNAASKRKALSYSGPCKQLFERSESFGRWLLVGMRQLRFRWCSDALVPRLHETDASVPSLRLVLRHSTGNQNSWRRLIRGFTGFFLDFFVAGLQPVGGLAKTPTVDAMTSNRAEHGSPGPFRSPLRSASLSRELEMTMKLTFSFFSPFPASACEARAATLSRLGTCSDTK